MHATFSAIYIYLDRIGHVGDIIVAGVLMVLGSDGNYFAVSKYRKSRDAGALTADDLESADVHEIAVSAKKHIEEEVDKDTEPAATPILAPSWDATSATRSCKVADEQSSPSK